MFFSRFKEGKEIPDVDARHNIKTIGKVSYLVISNSKTVDSGRYSCTVQNISGSTETSSQVTVQGELIQ